MSKAKVGFVFVGIAVLCTCSWALADAVAEYQGLFGEEEKTAGKTVKGSVELAAKLLGAAKSAAAQKELQALFCEKAYAFGMKAPAGYQAAADAMKLLVESGGGKAAAQDKLVKVTELRYAKAAKDDRKQLGEELLALLIACGDDRAEAKQPVEAGTYYRRAQALAPSVQPERAQQVADRIKDLAAAQVAQRKVAELRAQLARDPKNTAVREGLILAYLGELDDPNEAGKLLTPEVNEGLRTYVPLAANKLDQLPEAGCLDLAEWYASIAEKASPASKAVLLGRARACGERYLAVYQPEDASRVKAKLLLAKVDKALEAAGGAREITLALAEGVTMRLIRIPAGKFVMGSPDTEPGRRPDEGPQRMVTISRPFYMGVYEVTQAQYVAVMGRNPVCVHDPNGPAEGVDWHAAVEFCKRLSEKTSKAVRLPSEAEWEYACRAGTRSAYSFGEDPIKVGDYGWFQSNMGEKVRPVGQKKPNSWGLHDMIGGVAEWCSDWHAESYAKAKTLNPLGPDSGTQRVMRGSHWGMGPRECRSAYRDGVKPTYGGGCTGFRVVVGAAGAG